MYCNNCGAPVPDGSTICPSCNAVQNNQQQNSNGTYYTPPSSANTAYGSYNQQGYAQQGNYNQPQDNYFNNAGYNTFSNQYESDLKNAKLFGILALVIGLLLSRTIGIILGVIGHSKAKNIPDSALSPELLSLKNNAIQLNKLGIIIPAVFMAFGVVFMIIYFVFITVFMTGAASF